MPRKLNTRKRKAKGNKQTQRYNNKNSVKKSRKIKKSKLSGGEQIFLEEKNAKEKIDKYLTDYVLEQLKIDEYDNPKKSLAVEKFKKYLAQFVVYINTYYVLRAIYQKVKDEKKINSRLGLLSKFSKKYNIDEIAQKIKEEVEKVFFTDKLDVYIKSLNDDHDKPLHDYLGKLEYPIGETGKPFSDGKNIQLGFKDNESYKDAITKHIERICTYNYVTEKCDEGLLKTLDQSSEGKINEYNISYIGDLIQSNLFFDLRQNDTFYGSDGRRREKKKDAQGNVEYVQHKDEIKILSLVGKRYSHKYYKPGVIRPIVSEIKVIDWLNAFRINFKLYAVYVILRKLGYGKEKKDALDKLYNTIKKE